MSWRSVVRAAARLGVVMSVALTGMAFGADDADARRGGKLRAAPHASGDSSAPSHKSNGSENGEASGHVYAPVPRVRSRDASRGDVHSTTDVGVTSARRPLHTPPGAPVAQKDIDVAGCADGMICTVCVAGCYGDAGQIVDAQIRTPMPRRREQ